MIRAVLDTNVIVSAVLVPAGTQALVLLLAFRGAIELYVSAPVLAEYEEVLRRPRFKLEPRQIEATMGEIRRVGHLVDPLSTLSISTHESDNRFLECAEVAEADYFVTGNTRHFPRSHKKTKVVTGRQLLETIAAQRDEGR